MRKEPGCGKNHDRQTNKDILPFSLASDLVA